MSDTYGPKLPDAFAYCDPESSSVRMSQLSWDSLMFGEKSSWTSPKSGLMLSGQLYGLPTLELLTDGSASSLLRTPQAQVTEAKGDIKLTGRKPSDPQVGLADQVVLLGTPTAHERTHTPRQVDHGVQLANQVAALLPTPAAADGTGGKQHKKGTFTRTGMKEDGTKIQVSLRDALNLLPTPCARPDGKSPEAHMRMKANMPGGPRFKATSLEVVLKMLPTPRAMKGSGGSITETMYALGAVRTDEKRPQGQVLMPTPAARDWKGGTTPESFEATRRPRGDGGASDLPSVVKLLPTPTSADYKGATSPEACQDWDSRGTNLPEAAQGLRAGQQTPSRLLSTPQARDWKGEPGPAHENGGLTRQTRLLSTPRASDSNGAGKHGTGGPDLRTQIQEIGDRTSMPSEDGNPSLDDEPPTLWMSQDD